MSSTTIENEIQLEPAAIKAWAECRIIGFPADRFKIPEETNNEQLKKAEVRPNGFALLWEDLDKEITITGILEGNIQLPK